MSEKHKWVVKVDGADIAGLVLAGARINYGRRTVDEQPAPATAILTLLTPDVSDYVERMFPDFAPGDFALRSGYVDAYSDTFDGGSSRLTIGAAVSVEAATSSGYVDAYSTTFDGSQLTRFTGRITALDYSFGTIQLTCVDRVEPLARIVVTCDRPSETDASRVSYYGKRAGYDVDVDGDTAVMLTAHDKETFSNALEEIYKAAEDNDGIFYADRNGKIIYRTRTATPRPVTKLPPDYVILDSIRVTSELGDIVNDAYVEFGIENPDTGSRPFAHTSDELSKKRYGLMAKSFSTILANRTDAQAKANRIVAEQCRPRYSMPNVSVTLVRDEVETVDAMASLDIDDRILLEKLPKGSPMQTFAALILGYSEEISPPDWVITYNIAPTDYLEGEKKR